MAEGSDWAVAGEGAMQVVSGVQSKVTPLLGDVFVLAELLPSWLLLLQDRTETVPTVLTQFECPWFVSALRLKYKLHSGILPCQFSLLASVSSLFKAPAVPFVSAS